MLYSRSQTTQLFSSVTSRMQSVYKTLLSDSDSETGITTSDLISAYSNNDISTNDLSFVQLLQGKFSSADADKNGEISSAEYATMTTKMQTQGLSYSELSALASSQGTSSSKDDKSLLQVVMENFDEVDTNNDGKVSETEINAYALNKDFEDTKADIIEQRSKSLSIFYGNDDSSDSDETEDTTV